MIRSELQKYAIKNNQNISVWWNQKSQNFLATLTLFDATKKHLVISNMSDVFIRSLENF